MTQKGCILMRMHGIIMSLNESVCSLLCCSFNYVDTTGHSLHDGESFLLFGRHNQLQSIENMNNLSSQNHCGSKPIVICGELSSSEDDDTSSQKRTPSSVKNRQRKALSLEISPLAYFTELEAVMLKENGIGQLNDQLPLVIQISRDRANDEKPKKHLRRRRHGRKITTGTGNTTILYIVQIPATTQIRPAHL